jgi:hypothetical protein
MYDLPSAYLSHSQVSLFLQCPRKYEYQYVQKRRQPPTGALAYGTAIHKALEVAYTYKRDSRAVPPPEYVLQAFLEAWGQKKHVPFDSGDWNSHAALGVLSLQAYHAQLLPHHTPVHMEVSHSMDVGDGLQYTGVIDLYTEEGRVIDFKTAKRMWTDAQARETTQLTGYTLLLTDLTGLCPTGTGIHCLAKDGSVRHLDGGARTQEDIDTYVRTLHNVALQITEKRFIRRTKRAGNYLCDARWCPFYEECHGTV